MDALPLESARYRSHDRTALHRQVAQAPEAAAKPDEPALQGSPLGEWYADLDFWRRQPFVVMLNAATGAVLVLPGDAANLWRLQECARQQLAMLAEQFGLRGVGVEAELDGFRAGFAFGATRDRSLLASLNQRKYGVWLDLDHGDHVLPDLAAREWNGFFKHPALGRSARRTLGYHIPLDLVRQRLMPPADVLPFTTMRH